MNTFCYDECLDFGHLKEGLFSSSFWPYVLPIQVFRCGPPPLLSVLAVCVLPNHHQYFQIMFVNGFWLVKFILRSCLTQPSSYCLILIYKRLKLGLLFHRSYFMSCDFLNLIVLFLFQMPTHWAKSLLLANTVTLIW